MKSIVGLVEYTVTGAFLWLALLVLAMLTGENLNPFEGWLDYLLEHSKAMAEELDERTMSLLKDGVAILFAGIVFISVFATGLFIDLVAPIACGAFEIRWIRKWLLKKEEEWFVSLVAEYGELVGPAYARLTDKKLARWKPAFLLAEAYRVVSAFVLTYALGGAKNAQTEQLLERMKIWRVTRALAVTMLILAVALLLAGPSSRGDPSKFFLFRLLTPALLLLSAWYMTRTSFLDVVQGIRTACFMTWSESRRTGTARAEIRKTA